MKDLIGALLVSYWVLNCTFGNAMESTNEIIIAAISIIIGCVLLNFESEKETTNTNN